MIRRKDLNAKKIAGTTIVTEKRKRGRPKRQAPITSEKSLKKGKRTIAAPQPPLEDGSQRRDPALIKRSPANEIALNERRREVLSMLRRGYSIDETAEALKLDRDIVSDDYNAELYALRRHNMNDADKIREDELWRLNQITKNLLPMCEFRETPHPKDPNVTVIMPPSPPHVFAMVKVMERRAKMLGIDAPEKKIDITVPWESLTPDQVARISAGGDIRTILMELESDGSPKRRALVLAAKNEDIIEADEVDV